MHSPLTERLINALKGLPGVGPKSAQRMAFEILNRKRREASELSQALTLAVENVKHCEKCRFWTEAEICHICSNPKRNSDMLCIVESPSDVLAIEQTQTFKGHYFVLHGKLSPMDGLGPEQLSLPQLKQHAEQFSEIILALTPSLEAEATAHFIIESLKHQPIKCTRIAHGIPMGGELDYLDGNTVAKAFNERVYIERNLDETY